LKLLENRWKYKQQKIKKDEHKQRWTIHLDRMADETTPKYIIQYKPKGC
jgi:hypothetical protein